MKKLSIGFLLGASGAILAGKASAGLIYATGFEPSGSAAYPADNYTANQTLNGQQGWTSAVGGAPYPVAGVYNYATTFGSNSNPSNLQFAGLVDSGVSTGASGFYSHPTPYTPNPSNGNSPVVNIIFQLGTPQAGAGDPFFGVVAQTGTTAIAGFGVDGNGGTLSTLGGTLTGNTPFAGSANPGTSTFYNYELQLNFSSQSFAVYAAPLGATSFPASGLINSGQFLNPATSLSDAALTSFALTSTPATGNGYFDNYSVSSVPEPASCGMILSGVAAGLLRRRRNHRA